MHFIYYYFLINLYVDYIVSITNFLCHSDLTLLYLQSWLDNVILELISKGEFEYSYYTNGYRPGVWV
jgi:hypothetical protein